MSKDKGFGFKKEDAPDISKTLGRKRTENNVTLTLHTTRERKRAFKLASIKAGTDMSTLINAYMETYLDENEPGWRDA